MRRPELDDAPPAWLLDGRGGARLLDREARQRWKPPDGPLWIELNAGSERELVWLGSELEGKHPPTAEQIHRLRRRAIELQRFASEQMNRRVYVLIIVEYAEGARSLVRTNLLLPVRVMSVANLGCTLRTWPCFSESPSARALRRT